METQYCLECGTQLIEVRNCKEYFDKMIAWDFADFIGVGQIHHLTVLCYYLQHPSHYSVEGLKNAILIFKKAIHTKIVDRELYQLESDTFSSSQRTWKVTGTQTNHGKYSREIKWTMTVSAVVEDGVSKYPEYVKKWANSIYDDLKVSGELV